MDLSSSQLARQELSRALRARVTLSVPARTCRVAQCVGLGLACAFQRQFGGSPAFCFTVGFLNTFLVLTRTESDEK